MALPDDAATSGPDDEPPTPPDSSDEPATPRRGAHLRIVK